MSGEPMSEQRRSELERYRGQMAQRYTKDAIGDLLAEVDRLTAERVGHTLVPDAILEGLGQHDASGTDHLEEAMEACRERDVAEAEVRRLEAENARLRVISEAAQRLAFAAKQLEGWTDAFDIAVAEVIIAARTAPEQPANEAGEENEHG